MCPVPELRSTYTNHYEIGSKLRLSELGRFRNLDQCTMNNMPRSWTLRSTYANRFEIGS